MATDERRRRYRKPGIKDDRLEVRLSREDLSMLDYLSYETGLSKSDIIRRGLKIQYNMVYYSR